MKKKRGRKKDSGVLSGIDPQSESWTDIRNRLIYDSAEWPIVKLQSLLGSKLPDNFLSIEETKYEQAMQAHVSEREAICRKYRDITTGKVRRKLKESERAELWQRLQNMRDKQPMLSPVLDAWRTLRTRFERAVMDGDADWFKRQKEALGSKQSQERIQFNAAVVRQFELSMWGTDAIPLTRKEKWTQDSTLTPAGKFTDAMARHIFNALHIEEKRGVLYVEGRPFESKERAMDAIHDLATKLQFALKKQARKR